MLQYRIWKESDSEGQVLDKLKDKGAKALKIKSELFWRSRTMVLKMSEGQCVIVQWRCKEGQYVPPLPPTFQCAMYEAVVVPFEKEQLIPF